MYMVNLDLSCNSISGENLFSTLVTKDLQLIMDALSSKVPEKIGLLVQVKSLDLSHNEFPGRITTSLSALTSLSLSEPLDELETSDLSAGAQIGRAHV